MKEQTQGALRPVDASDPMSGKRSMYKLLGGKVCWQNQEEPHASLFSCSDDACGFLVYPEGEMFTLLKG